MARRQKPIRIRRLWRIHPRTRVKPSGKRYRRTETRRRTRKVIKEEMEVSRHEA